MEEEEAAEETCETVHQEFQSFELDHHPQPPPPVPRRVQELRNPKSRPRKSIKSRARERLARDDARRSPSPPPRWRVEVISALESGQSFSTRVKILRIVDRIAELRDHVPQLVSSNAKLRSYTVRYTRCELAGFEGEARRSRFGYGKILRFKHQLYGFVKLMYQSGVRYNIYPARLFLYTPPCRKKQREPSSSSSPSSSSTRQLLFLGGVEDSDLVDAATDPDWSEYRKHVWEHIHRVFATLEIWTYRGEAIDLMATVDRERIVVDRLLGDSSAVIDAAREDVDEARTIMARTREVFNTTVASIKRLEVLSGGLVASTRGPLLVWEDAQSRKEVLEKNLKKIEVLDCRTNALIDKYRGPLALEDGVSWVDVAPPQLGDDDDYEESTDAIELSGGAEGEEEVVIWDEGEAVQEEEVAVQEEEASREEEVVVYEDATAQDEVEAGDDGSEEESSQE